LQHIEGLVEIQDSIKYLSDYVFSKGKKNYPINLKVIDDLKKVFEDLMKSKKRYKDLKISLE